MRGGQERQVRRRSGERGAGETGDPALIVRLFQINSPRHLPLSSCGKVVQAACGGTQVAVLNGQFTPQHTWTHLDTQTMWLCDVIS